MSGDKLGKPNRFLDGKKSDLPERPGVSRLDVEGFVKYEGERAVEVDAYGMKLPVDENNLVKAPGGTFQLMKVHGRDCLVPVI
jgi:hypothetical protein